MTPGELRVEAHGFQRAPVVTVADDVVQMDGGLWEQFGGTYHGGEHGGTLDFGTPGAGLGVVRYRHVGYSFATDTHTLRRIS